ncbi:hypothetical protein [Actinomadura sp. WAC 06369]|uniref:hypothetical protein n=1 Tax=Actinomadura sp. WAC 06369 TaxID=2203193 RepID=UPI000F775CC1|nr:hypothetical protein [Actinomadura sp. WAC 06369]RSN62029.1 hypothetical protein DMH08_20010 [Actinomadura sp. WAC 06369]
MSDARCALWFLAAYLPMIALTPPMHALHRRWGLAVPVVLAVLVALGDAARLWADVPHGGTANYLLMWLAVHQLGFAWHDGRLRAPAGRLLLLAGLCGLVLLTTAGPYPVSMVAEPGAAVQNTAPPTLALLCLAAAQAGAVLLLHDRGGRWLRRPRGPAGVDPGGLPGRRRRPPPPARLTGRGRPAPRAGTPPPTGPGCGSGRVPRGRGR